ncbi:hypothetical protein BGX23_006627 [Mortierella sp. AD031]|nr:hypothetical protein BGX23_006627 [Mortierella sp. AD031]
MPASTDPFSKEVTDHLLQIFFEHCFQDFNCFSPVAFLRLYLQGTINPDLLYAVCAVAARFSNHPAVVRTPPSSSGQVYVDRIKAGMIHLLAQVNLDAVHTLILLSHAEYCAGHHPQGYRLAGMAARMLPELGLHRLKGPDKSFDSDTDRIAFEVKIRTLSLVAINDTIASLLSDQPGALEHTDIMYPTPENKVDWWIERISSGQAMEPMDDYSISILHKILRSNRTGVGEYQAYTLQLLSVGTTIRKFNNRVASSSKKRSPQGTGKELQIPNPTVTTTTTPIPNTAAPSTTDGCQVQDVQGAYQVAETELKRWRANIPEHWEPTKSIFLASQTENDGLPTVALYNVLVILLNRPVLLKACMSTISRKESHGPFGVIHGDGAKVSEPCVGKDGYVSPDNTRERRGSESKEEEEADSQMLEAYLYKCVVAADEIATIVGRFTDDDVKYRGFNYSFAALMAGTVYIIQQLMNKDLTKVGIGEEGLMVCQHFLRTLGRYWGGAVDQDRLLDRRSLFDAAKVEDDSNTTTGDPLSDIVLTTSSSDADELNDFDLYNGGEDTQGQKMSLQSSTKHKRDNKVF